MKNIVMVLLVLTYACFLTGCWDRTEINDLTIVTGVGIDQKDEDRIELIVEVNIPKSMGQGGGEGSAGRGGGPRTLVRSGVGKTMGDAISDLQMKLSREIFWGHVKVIVIGKKLAQAGFREHLDFLARHPETRLRVQVFVADGTAKDILSLQSPIERSPSEALREMAVSELLMEVTLKDLLQMLISDGQAAAVPMVRILPPGKGLEPLQTIPYVYHTAIFKKDKMVGQIDDRLTRGMLWVRNELRHATVTTRTHQGKGYVSGMLLRANSKLIPKIEDGKWKMTIQAVSEDDVVANGSDLDLMNPAFIQMLEKKMEQDIEQLITQTLESVQKQMKADVFGFAEAFHRKYPKEWQKVKKDWDAVFPAIEVNYEIKAYIRRPGLSTGPQGLPEDEVKKK